MNDNGSHLLNEIIDYLLDELMVIHHKKSVPYHPQVNGQVEVTNKELENILTKIVALLERIGQIGY